MAFEVARVHSQLCTSLSPTWAFAAHDSHGHGQFSGSSDGYPSFDSSFFGPPRVQSWTNSYVGSSWQQEDLSEGDSAEDFHDDHVEGMAELVAQLALQEDEDEDCDGNDTGENSETDDSSMAFTSDTNSKVDSVSTCSESCSSQSSPTLGDGSGGSSAWESVDKFISPDILPMQTTVHYNMNESHARRRPLGFAEQQLLLQNFLAAELRSSTLTQEGKQALFRSLRALQLQALILEGPRLTAKPEKKMPSVVLPKDQQGSGGRRGKKDRRGASSECAKQEKKNPAKGGGNRTYQKGRNGKNSSTQGKARNGDKQWVPGAGGNSGLRAIFLKAGGAASADTPGTGVFLPRSFGGSSDHRKKPACSTVLLPTRVYDVLRLHENPHIKRSPLAVPIATAPRIVHADGLSTTQSVPARATATVTLKAPPKVVYREDRAPTPIVCHTMYSAETDCSQLPTEWSY